VRPVASWDVLTCCTGQYYGRQWLSNTEWSNCRSVCKYWTESGKRHEKCQQPVHHHSMTTYNSCVIMMVGNVLC